MAASTNYRNAWRALGWTRNKGLAALGAVGGFGQVVARMALPWIVGLIIDDALVRGDAGALVRWCVVLAAVAATAAVLQGVFEVSFSYVGARSLGDLQGRLFRQLHGSPLGGMGEDTSGRLNALFTNDARKVGLLYNPLLRQGIYAVFQLVVLTSILVFQYGSLVFLAGLIVPIYVIFPLVLGKPTRKASKRLQESEAEVSSWLQETIGGLRELKALGRAAWSEVRLDGRISTVVKERLRLALINWGYGLNRVIYWAALGVIYWQGGQEVIAGRLSIGELVALVSYLGYLEAPVGRFFALHSQLEALAGPLSRVMAFLDRPVESSGDLTVQLPQPPEVSLEGVTFCYPEAERPALDGLSLTVEPGQQVAVVGPSGAGKSTLLRLLLRLDDPEEGAVRLDGRDLRDLDLDSLRQAVSVVFQRPDLFSLTIEENLRLGRPEASDEELRQAAVAAHADGFIRDLPEGYATEIGEQGAKLSVGQRQRLAIARALLKDSPLVLLDEATSALDAGSEDEVRKGLERLMEGRTSIVVAHRLSTVREADRIFVLDQGRLTASGSHDELLTSSLTYRKFHQLQASA